MKYRIVAVFMFLTLKCVCQEKLDSLSNVSVEDNIIGKPFDGTKTHRKKNGNLISKIEYINGFQVKYSAYYNIEKEVPYEEIYYHQKAPYEKYKRVKLRLDGSIYAITYFDMNGKKILDKEYVGDKLVYSCEYKNGKKHGKKICLSKEGELLTYIYENGKKVK